MTDSIETSQIGYQLKYKGDLFHFLSHNIGLYKICKKKTILIYEN